MPRTARSQRLKFFLGYNLGTFQLVLASELLGLGILPTLDPILAMVVGQAVGTVLPYAGRTFVLFATIGTLHGGVHVRGAVIPVSAPTLATKI
ncbi:MAG: hypothetical protein AB7C95_00840 [Synergistaceae bacterium]